MLKLQKKLINLYLCFIRNDLNKIEIGEIIVTSAATYHLPRRGAIFHLNYYSLAQLAERDGGVSYMMKCHNHIRCHSKIIIWIDVTLYSAFIWYLHLQLHQLRYLVFFHLPPSQECSAAVSMGKSMVITLILVVSI